MRAGPLRRSIGAGSRIGTVLDIDFRKVDVAADQYFMDRSVYGHKCQAKGGPKWNLPGNDFDGSADYVICGNHASFSFGSGEFSLEASIKTAVNATMQIACKRDGGTNGFYNLYVFATKLRAELKDAESDACSLESKGSTVIDGVLRHLSVRRTAALLSGFVDGDMIGTVDASAVGDTDNGAELQVGRWKTDTQHFDDMIASARVYNQAEYAARILQRAIDSRRN